MPSDSAMYSSGLPMPLLRLTVPTSLRDSEVRLILAEFVQVVKLLVSLH